MSVVDVELCFLQKKQVTVWLCYIDRACVINPAMNSCKIQKCKISFPRLIICSGKERTSKVSEQDDVKLSVAPGTVEIHQQLHCTVASHKGLNPIALVLFHTANEGFPMRGTIVQHTPLPNRYAIP
ncbi:hypothetical protein SADUNF_Sadunf04G0092000 [Salix dunnii]|uniref:Uncharacterized protein n=1 Tax=Salix dunnii TaxID=1413687 RepID=A0A835N3Z2_9ROSI|nr:hypothetical protein SADUNF_Sadunf04G0092000 [Salix dunnii]